MGYPKDVLHDKLAGRLGTLNDSCTGGVAANDQRLRPHYIPVVLGQSDSFDSSLFMMDVSMYPPADPDMGLNFGARTVNVPACEEDYKEYGGKVFGSGPHCSLVRRV